MQPLRATLRFLLLGGLLFAALQAWHGVGPRAPGRELVIDPARVDRLVAATTRRLGRAPTAAEREALIRQLADEEMLVDEALARGLDRGDLLVRRRLLQNMRFVARSDDASSSEQAMLARAYRLDMPRRDPVVRRRLVQRMQMVLIGQEAAPSAAEVAAMAQQQAAKMEQPQRLQFRQVYASGEDAEARLSALALQGLDPDAAAQSGDPFLMPARIGPETQEDIARDFGANFAAEVMQLPVGQWSRPIRSAYGWHLVWVDRRWAQAPPDADYARRQARLALRDLHEQEQLAAATRALRSHYRLRLDTGEHS